MNKKLTSSLIIFVALVLFIIFEILGLTVASKIVGLSLTIALLIINIPNINAMNKKLLAIVMSITIIPGLVLIYSMFSLNIYLLDISLICFLLSFPISIAIILIHKKNYAK